MSNLSNTTGSSGATDKAKAAASEATSQGQQVAQHAASNAKDVASTAQAGAHEVVGQAREQASQLTGQATDHIRNLASQATGQIQEQASTQADRAAQQMHTVSSQLRALAEGRTDEAGQVTQYVQQAADKMSEVAQRLETGGLQGVAGDLSNMARRRPGAFLLSCGVVGFAAGRLLRGAQTAKQMDSSSETQGAPALATHRSPVAETIDLTAPAHATYEGEHAYGRNVIGGV